MAQWTHSIQGPSYALSSWLFLRLLGIVYLAAFASLATQVRGLLGRNGLLPAREFLLSHRHWSTARFWRWPTLLWFQCSDEALLVLTWGGAALSVLLMLGLATLPVLIALWVFYLSLFNVGRIFLCYQWDILLLESGFLAIFLAPSSPAFQSPWSHRPSLLSVYLLWWLLFRLIFFSGFVKLRSGDNHWRSFTALKYHYET